MGAEAIEMVTREEAERAVHTLLGYLEADPKREGLACLLYTSPSPRDRG